MLDDLYAAAGDNDAAATMAQLRRMLPEYQPVHQPLTPAAVGAPYADGF
jgi:hypothetical protein